MLKKITYILLAVLVIIQFIRPARNTGMGPYPNDITTRLHIPNDVMNTFQQACYDCHSNHTKYPWYANVQPLAWWIQDHVNDGKRHFNFHEFASYSPKKQKHKLEEIIETIEKGEMPMESYTWLHKEARLSATQIAAIKNWVTEAIAQYPEE